MPSIAITYIAEIAVAQYLFFACVLPTGTVWWIPLKHISALLLVAVCLFVFTKQRLFRVSSAVKFVASCHLIIPLYVLVAIGNDYDAVYSMKHLIMILSISLPTVLIFILLDSKIISTSFLMKTLVISSACYGTWKSTLFVGAFLGLIEFEAHLKPFFEITGYKPVGMAIVGGFARLNYTVLDLSYTCVFLLYICRGELFLNKRLMYTIPYVVLTLLVVFSAYSRFNFAVLFLVFLVYLALSNIKSLTFFVALLFMGFFLFSESISPIIEQRFLNQESSDNERVIMIQELTSLWEMSPLFGNGLGSYVKSYIRMEELPFSYEAQLLITVAQMGVPFIIFISTICLWLCFRIVHSKGEALVGAVLAFVLFVLVIFGSLTNQYLLSSGTISLILTIYLLQCGKRNRGGSQSASIYAVAR